MSDLLHKITAPCNAKIITFTPIPGTPVLVEKKTIRVCRLGISIDPVFREWARRHYGKEPNFDFLPKNLNCAVCSGPVVIYHQDEELIRLGILATLDEIYYVEGHKKARAELINLLGNNPRWEGIVYKKKPIWLAVKLSNIIELEITSGPLKGSKL
jgi:hypothetical protein